MFLFRCRGGNSKVDVDIINIYFCFLLFLGLENIFRIFYKEVVLGFFLEIVVVKDNEFLLF